MKTWAELGIDTKGKATGELKTVCPWCSPYRKKSTYPCLNVNLDKGCWHCWHCEASGSLAKGEEHRSNPRATPLIFRKPVYRQTPLPTRVLDWFASRGIPEAILARRRISYGPVYMPQVEQEMPAIQFPYFRQGEVVNCKYRDGHKHFRMAGGAERILYGLDDVSGDSVLICEGEMDALALEVAGYTSVVSVPDGAPAPGTKNYESKFDFLVSAEEILAPLKRIVIAVDSDAPGQKLAEELARRLGPERCWRVEWSGGCKDANDVLMNHGKAVLAECVEAAQPWPVSGIVTMDQLRQAILYMYDHGMERGSSTGWPSINRHYTVRPGELTIISGVPAHGKSTWLSALTIQMARHLASTEEWKFTYFSPENFPLHRFAASLLEQDTGKSFDGHADRMTRAELLASMEWLNERTTFLMPEDDVAPTVDCILDLAKVQVYRQGIKGLIIDPWNEVEHWRPDNKTETQYISEVLSKIRRFARNHGVHVWLVAHPTKLRKEVDGDYKGQYAPPTPYDIAGSAHWRAKADNCVTIWRNVEADNNLVQIHIQKIRFREIGKPGIVDLRYDPRCGRFEDLPQQNEQRWSA